MYSPLYSSMNVTSCPATICTAGSTVSVAPSTPSSLRISGGLLNGTGGTVGVGVARFPLEPPPHPTSATTARRPAPHARLTISISPSFPPGKTAPFAGPRRLTSVRLATAYHASLEVDVGEFPVFRAYRFVEHRARGQVPGDERVLTVDRDPDEDSLAYLFRAHRHGDLQPAAQHIHPGSAGDRARGDDDGSAEYEVDLAVFDVAERCPSSMAGPPVDVCGENAVRRNFRIVETQHVDGVEIAVEGNGSGRMQCDPDVLAAELRAQAIADGRPLSVAVQPVERREHGDAVESLVVGDAGERAGMEDRRADQGRGARGGRQHRTVQGVTENL